MAVHNILLNHFSCVANGELLSMSLLLEEVALSLVTEQCDPATHSESDSTFCAPSQKLSEHGILRGVDSQSSSMSLTNRSKPVTTSMSTFQPYIHTPPLEGHNILKEFLQKSSQLEVLKEEWSSEFLPNRGPCTPKQYKIFQSVGTTDNLNFTIVCYYTQGYVPKQSITTSQAGCGKEEGYKSHKGSLRKCESIVLQTVYGQVNAWCV